MNFPKHVLFRVVLVCCLISGSGFFGISLVQGQEEETTEALTQETTTEVSPQDEMSAVVPEEEMKAEQTEGETSSSHENDTFVDKAAFLPPTNVIAMDKPYDPGAAILIEWTPPPNDVVASLKLDTNDSDKSKESKESKIAELQKEMPKVVRYIIYRGTSAAGPFEEIGIAVAGRTMSTDSKGITDGVEYYYQVAADYGKIQTLSETSGAAVSSAQWLALNRWNIFILAVLFSAFILYNIQRASGGQDLFIRKIAGLNAVEEAIGRATEMGRNVLYVPGIMDMDDVQTIAAINILGQVARKTAEYDTPLMVPCCRSVVMSTAQEVVKEAYLSAGRPDAYKQENIRYLTDDQFGYAAGVDGIMVREKPATNFFLGRFYAESLILAETGNFIGAIQIAGTAEASQIPFFITACDYTLIGEELFAAGAYLSREPMLLGSLKGQDWGKFFVMASIVVGVILESFDISKFTQFFSVH